MPADVAWPRRLRKWAIVFVTIALGLTSSISTFRLGVKQRTLRRLESELAERRTCLDEWVSARSEFDSALRAPHAPTSELRKSLNGMKKPWLLRRVADGCESLPTNFVFFYDLMASGFAPSTVLLQVPNSGQTLVVTVQDEFGTQRQFEVALNRKHLYRIEYSAGGSFGLDGWSTPQGLRVDGATIAEWQQYPARGGGGTYGSGELPIMAPNRLYPDWFRVDEHDSRTLADKLQGGYWCELIFRHAKRSGNPVWVRFELQSDGPFELSLDHNGKLPATADARYDEELKSYVISAVP